MTPKTLFEMAKENGAEDYELCFSKLVVVDEKEELRAIFDVPVHGLAYNNDDKELRLVVISENVEGLAKNMGITIKPIPTEE